VKYVQTVSFGPFKFEPSSGRLTKHGNRIKLQGKSAEILRCLLEQPGQLITRAEIVKRLWPDGTYVDYELGVRVALKKLRDALGDSPDDAVYIQTVRGEGYRFIAPVAALAEEPIATELTVESAPPQSAPVAWRTTIEQAVAGDPVSSSARFQNRATSAGALAESQIFEREQETDLSVPASIATQPWFQTQKLPVTLAVVLCIAVFSVIVAKLQSRTLRKNETTNTGKTMVVVLPFENLSGDPGQEYFSDGMTEELSEHLGNQDPQRLGVIGRTSAITYKHSPRTISQIGKDLAVDYVLEGSVRRDRSKLRVTAQLVRVSDQTHVWAEDYDRDVRDLLQVEDDVASDIAQHVGVSVALGQPAKSLRPHTPTPEGHEAYLLARYYWYKRTPAGRAAAEEYFRRAIEKDAQYAAAYAGLAECTPKAEAKAAAMKAVELDPTSGEARTALGWVEFYRNLDLAAAEAALKTAVQLDPNYAPAHHTYSGVLEATGRFQEAISEQKQAVLLDPLAHISRASLAEILSVVGENDRAVEQLNQIFAMDPQYPKAHETLGTIYLRRGMYKEAIREYQASEQYGGAKLLGLLGYAYARSGNKDQALRTLSELKELGKGSPSGAISYDLALIEIGLGNRNEALTLLEKVYQQHDDDGLLFLKYEPIFAPLRSDPLFQDLLRRMNFPT
jgi:TolB-like protein/DNA-binding winged helix-turn-helix (wHTH) protein/Flp pilus assembly protein TadD